MQLPLPALGGGGETKQETGDKGAKDVMHKQRSSPVLCPCVVSTRVHVTGIVTYSVMLGKEDYLWGQACQDVATCS